MRVLLKLFWLTAGLLVLAGFVLAFLPQPVTVDTATIGRGPLSVTVDDDGITRVRERYTISAPVYGRLVRTLLEPDWMERTLGPRRIRWEYLEEEISALQSGDAGVPVLVRPRMVLGREQ